MLKSDLTLSEVKFLLDYDKLSGKFYWKNSKKVKTGAIAGSINAKGYIVVNIRNKLYLAHRLAWFYIHSVWPSGYIDHIDRDKTNNKIENLRVVTKSENGQNSSKKSKAKTKQSKYKGVYWVNLRSRWVASISKEGKKYHLGTFLEEKEAAKSYILAKMALHPLIEKKELKEKYYLDEIIGDLNEC